MSTEIASDLFQSGRCHALSADLLFRAALDDGENKNVADPELYAFNGPHSLSIHYLLGLGLELMLKSAICAYGGDCSDKALRAIGHDLIQAFNTAEAVGFTSQAPHLRDILAVLQEPYKAHWFRYGEKRPNEFPLPGDFQQIVETLKIFDEELQDLLWTKEEIEAIRISD